MKRSIISAVIVGLLCTPGLGGKQEVRRVTIGTGNPIGVYYQVANALKKMVQRDQAGRELDLVPVPSEGAVENLQGVLEGRYDFGIIQADKLFKAIHGSEDREESGPRTELRAVMRLHLEYLTLVVREDSGITRLQDIRDRRVNIGQPGSATRENVEGLLRRAGLWEGLRFTEKDPVDAVEDLKRGRCEAIFLVVGHPNPAIRELSAAQPVRIVPIEDPQMNQLVAQYPFLVQDAIPLGFYPKLANAGAAEVPTLALAAVLVTRADQPEDVVHTLTRAVLDGFDYFRQLHPALAEITPLQSSQGLIAPMHPGAERAFREAGVPLNQKSE